ncbi:MAG: hypothetical protein KJO81_02600 [Gammaproteobacteria bacterium]|nr:hypothetical protein [Gammaproteobacteria bacterium]
MSNLVVAKPTLSDAATLTESNSSADYPLTNALTQQPRETVRTNSNSDSYYVANLGAAYAINLIALLYTNADISTLWRIRGATSEANLTAAPGYDSGTLNLWGGGSPVDDWSDWDRVHGLHMPSTAQTYQWWRIDVSGLSGLSYFEFGRLYISVAYQPTRNADIGLKLTSIDSSFGIDTAAAHYRRQGRKYRSITARFSYRYESEAYDDWLVLDRTVGGGGDCFVCINPDSRIMDRSIYAYLENMGTLDHGIWNVGESSNLHTKEYTFTEFEMP